jgi:hypothetical protein
MLGADRTEDGQLSVKSILVERTRFNREIRWRSKHGMQFILGVVLFVVVVGAVDAGVPWPRCGAKEAKQ